MDAGMKTSHRWAVAGWVAWAIAVHGWALWRHAGLFAPVRAWFP